MLVGAMTITRRGFLASLPALVALPTAISKWPTEIAPEALSSRPLYVDALFKADPLMKMLKRSA